MQDIAEKALVDELKEINATVGVAILMEAGLANEAAVSQMEATYYTICTSVQEEVLH